MKLSAGVVFDNLKAEVPVEMYGQRSEQPLLERPQIYLGQERVFQPHLLYIARADRLPQTPDIDRNAVILCIGDSLRLPYYRERCCLLHVEKADMLHISNLVYGIFNRYAAWNEELYKILSSTASVQEMAAISCDIFGNPMFIVDSDFRVIANAGYDDADEQYMLQLKNHISLPAVGQYLELRELSMHVREPMLLNLLDTSTLCVNLYKSDEYIGCLAIDYRNRRHLSSDMLLGQHLANMIVLALQKLTAASSNEKNMLNHALQDMLDGLAIPTEQQRALEGMMGSEGYVCIKMRLGRFAELPIGYICGELENTFPKSIAFEYDNCVVGFVELGDIIDAEGQYQQRLKARVSEFIRSVDMRVGVSDPLGNLMDARLYYKQANSALESGSLFSPAERYYVFQDYALSEMIINTFGELPIEMYYTGGLHRLLRHDANSQVCYIDTLRAYLANNMSISKTAAAMYVHRSTLQERITRIERELETDLNDPDERLRIQLLLKAMEVLSRIRAGIALI